MMETGLLRELNREESAIGMLRSISAHNVVAISISMLAFMLIHHVVADPINRNIRPSHPIRLNQHTRRINRDGIQHQYRNVHRSTDGIIHHQIKHSYMAAKI